MSLLAQEINAQPGVAYDLLLHDFTIDIGGSLTQTFNEIIANNFDGKNLLINLQVGALIFWNHLLEPRLVALPGCDRCLMTSLLITLRAPHSRNRPSSTAYLRYRSRPRA